MTTTRTATDPRPTFSRALATTSSVIDAVTPDQLDRSTPCDEFTARDLLAHLVEVVERTAALGRGDAPFGFATSTASDDGWAACWRGAVAGYEAAWRDDAVLERPMSLPWMSGSGAEVLASYLSELTVHTWDLAKATDQSPAWDDDVLAGALEIESVLPAEGRLELFAEIARKMGSDEVAIPFKDAVALPAGAPAIDRLVAWTGRRP